VRPVGDFDREPQVLQFTLRDVALAIYGIGVILAVGRAGARTDLAPGHLALGAGLAIYLGGCLALWADRKTTAVIAMLFALGIILLGAAQCGGFP
jgi:hypothetical protein